MNHKVKESFDNLCFLNSSDLGFKKKKIFSSFLVDILPLDPHIFADPVSQNVADPTDPDPKN